MDFLCYDLPHTCILIVILLHSDWTCIVIRDGDTIDYEKLFAREYRNSISNQCTAEPSIEVILTTGPIGN